VESLAFLQPGFCEELGFFCFNVIHYAPPSLARQALRLLLHCCFHPLTGDAAVAKWPIGVFTSVDAGLGVKLEVAHELGVPTIQLHAPAQATRTQENAEAFTARLNELGIELTAVFGGFEGESYADIPTVKETVGLVPPATRAADSGIERDCRFRKALGMQRCGVAFGLHSARHQ